MGFSGGGMYKRPAYQRKIWGCHILTPKPETEREFEIFTILGGGKMRSDDMR